MAEKGGATLWMLFRLERYQLDTQHEEKKKYYRIAEKNSHKKKIGNFWQFLQKV